MRLLLARMARRLLPFVLGIGAAVSPVSAQAPPLPEAASAPQAMGELVILNDSGWTLVPSNQVVTDNGRQLVSLPRQTYARIAVAPGAHQLRPDPFLWKQEVDLEVAPGSRHYVVVAYKPERSWAAPLGGTPLVLRELSEAEALPLLREMKPM